MTPTTITNKLKAVGIKVDGIASDRGGWRVYISKGWKSEDPIAQRVKRAGLVYLPGGRDVRGIFFRVREDTP